MTEYDVLKDAFKMIGVHFEECDERQLKTEHPIPNAVKYISVSVAHYHFDAKGKYLGIECNGDGKTVHALIPPDAHPDLDA